MENAELALIQKAQCGDHQAFSALLESVRDRLKASLHARIGPHLQSRLDAEDVFQDVSTQAFQSIGGFEWRGKDSFFHWLKAIAEHRILKAAEKQKREEVFQLESQEQDPEEELATPSQAMRRDERFDRLEKALAGLSETHRQVILLARIEGLSMKEIAQRMNRSVSAVKNLLLRSLRELKESFGETESFHLPNRRLTAPEIDHGPDPSSEL